MRIHPNIALPRFLKSVAQRSFEKYLYSDFARIKEGYEFFASETDDAGGLDLTVGTFLTGECYVVARAFAKQFLTDGEDHIEEMIVRVDPKHRARIFNGDCNLQLAIQHSFQRAISSVAEFCLDDSKAVRTSILSELSSNGIYVFPRFCELPQDRIFIGDISFPYMYPRGGNYFGLNELTRLRHDLWQTLDEADRMQVNDFLDEKYNATAAQLGVEQAFCYKVHVQDVE